MKYTTIGLILSSTLAFAGCKCSDETAAQSSMSDVRTDSDTAVSSTKPLPPSQGDPLAYKKATRTDSVRFETTNGEIIIDVFRDLAPKGADRFLALVNAGFYNGVAIHQAKDGFAVRAGISPNPMVNTLWRKRPVPSDPVVQQNNVGWVALQTTIKGSPCTEFIINLRENLNLDAEGVAPFGKVRDMQVPDRMAFEYENFEVPDPKRIEREGYAYLKKEFPKLDYIKKATVISDVK